MMRKLVAALACRAGGSRLYGKPLQNLESDYTILDHILASVSCSNEIDEAVLGISEGLENYPFINVAHKHGVAYILGSEKDVLWRLIQCGRMGKATDIFRITTECPFPSWELLPEVFGKHIADKNDITVTDFLPEGMHFEIYTLDALEKMHREGNDAERSEFCSAYPRRCPKEFRIGLVDPPEKWKRMDLRFTVDYPEDLVLCRCIYRALKSLSPHISTEEIISWADEHPTVRQLVSDYVIKEPLWASVL